MSIHSAPPVSPPPIPGALPPARRLAKAILGPISSFLHIEAASGILLLVAAAAALAWASSPWHASYEHLWHVPVQIGAAGRVFSQPLHFWINDVLMVVFFFVVGLEIKREIHAGELSQLRRAALPVIAAVGGMIVPAALYLAIARQPDAKTGWGVPMATDIAFAVGVLALLGKRVPPAIRVLLLALAIIDDIGAILVIAIFYSSGLSLVGLGVAAAGVLGVVLLKAFGVRRPAAYVAPGVVMWAGFLQAGVHPTIAGVLLGLLTPAKPWYGVEGFLSTTASASADLQQKPEERGDGHRVVAVLDRVAEARREAVSPVVRLIDALHPWVAFGIMPLFAFANAGVRVNDVNLGGTATPWIVTGVVVGLCAGKPIGIVLASLLAVKLGIASRPRGVTWRGILVMGIVAGIGFTMAIFIASLAFRDPGLLGAAKLAVLAASVLAGVLALVAGRFLLAARPAEDAAPTAEEAETSTER
ncbi:MAG: Na+/H+ antiporter NhaA [Polyangiaceae bacterium]